ncbi:hypothetical protein D910_03506 [Dendroctonus ponderosae]|uniref:PARP catalytic domain-containing protein n=1 Tax=Dendroctonus ponderosae TaxID=77166 RepID=U4TZ24_DENPD|nr:hypothetical protein D910_03506 [Dendroctonus ponderosae]
MGIFSSKPVDNPQVQNTRILGEYRIQREAELRLERSRAIHLARWEEARRKSQAEVTANLNVLSELALVLGEQPIYEYPVKPYQENVLSETSWEFIAKASLFKKSNKHFFSISKITSVYNIFNSLHYKLAKLKYTTIYDKGCSERFVFHGTKHEFLAEICTYNFDRSKIKAHKFGHGISFATNSYYATHYPQANQRRFDKVMIIANVLVEDTIEEGHQFMTIPNHMGYTSSNRAQSVIVKYDDHTFFPVNIVYYQGLHPQKHAGSMVYYD